MLKVSLSLEGKGYLHFSDPSLLHRPRVLVVWGGVWGGWGWGLLWSVG